MYLNVQSEDKEMQNLSAHRYNTLAQSMYFRVPTATTPRVRRMSAGMMRLHVYISMVKRTLAMDAYATKRETQRP
jgi:hypothetical protein